MKCEEIHRMFAEAVYGELPDATMTAFNAHIASCTSCSRAFSELRGTLNLLSKRTRTEPTGEEWTAFTNRLQDRIGRIRRMEKTGEATAPAPIVAADRQSVPPPRKRLITIPWASSLRPAYAYSAAAVLLVVFGIYMGRTFFNGNTPATVQPETALNPAADTTGASPPEMAEMAGRPASSDTLTDSDREALAYLERSRNLLLGLTNLDRAQAAAVNLDRSRRVSRELYDQGNTLAVALNRPSQQQLRQLVQGLQIILLQLSNMEAANGTPVVEMVRKGVDAKSILLKINLEAIRAGLAAEGVRAEKKTDGSSL